MERPNYYAVIPAEVRYAKIPDGAKLLYGEVTALSSKEGYCWASNAHFAELYGVGANTISSWVNILKENGFVYVSLEKNSMRKIYLDPSKKLDTPSRKIVNPPHEKLDTSIKDSITLSNGVAPAPHLEIREVHEEDERPKRVTKAKYADAKIAFSWLPNQQKSWDRNITELECGLLLFGRGESAVRSFVKYVQSHQNDDFFNWTFVKPSDYERKWEDIKAYAKRNS